MYKKRYIQLISYKRFLECTHIQWRLSIYPKCTQVAEGTFFMKLPIPKIHKKNLPLSKHMTDHAGPRRYECNPGTKLWHPPCRSNTVLAAEEQFWRPFLERPKKIILIKRWWNSVKQKLLKMIQVTVWIHTDHLYLFGFTKTKTGAKTAPRAPKLRVCHIRI